MLKNALYFPVARYFRFFARIRLSRWNPRVVVVTGSNGKTTALNLIEVQLGKSARYSHGANSSFGISFDILGLKRKTYSPFEWITFGLFAPMYAWKKPYAEKIYVVEADCDRPYEGNFLSSLLKPEITVWLNSAKTHSVNFEKSTRAGRFSSVDKAIAHEFGYFAERTSKLVIVNADELLIRDEIRRTQAVICNIKEREQCERYAVDVSGTEFVLGGVKYHAPFLLPKETLYAIAASIKVGEYFGNRPTNDIWKFVMPPGRSSILKGIKNTTIIDSTYNANVASVSAVLRMVEKLPGAKWLVLGDMTEQGAQEKEEHEKAARLVAESDFERVVLVGPRLNAYALPLLPGAISFERPREALEYLRQKLKGGELIVFKGARFLEGIIEHLLADKRDADKLCRREKVWQKRRAQWGL